MKAEINIRTARGNLFDSGHMIKCQQEPEFFLWNKLNLNCGIKLNKLIEKTEIKLPVW